jgi:hypothetical protein
VPQSKRRTPAPGEPIVSTIERAAELLCLEPERLAQAVEAARLRPWGCHAAGQPVYKWDRLCSVAVELGATLPPRWQHSWSYEAAGRGRESRYGKARKQPNPGRAGAV